MAKFILVRHGESASNKAAILSDPTTPLTELGVEQAHQTGKGLANKGIKLLACSPFLRAQQTAAAMAEEMGLNSSDIQVIPGLEERRFGPYEGKPRAHESIWYVMAREEGMETPEELLKRSYTMLEKIKELSRTGLVAVVSHGAFSFYLQQAAKGIKSPADFPEVTQLSNAGYMEVEI